MENQEKEARKEAMKALRAQRKESVSRAISMMKKQKKQIETITGFLARGEATVPEIARAINMPTDQTLWYMATLKKYGQIVEGPKDGSFFKYKLNVEPGPQDNAIQETAEV